MVEKELKSIWKNASQTAQIKFDLSRLMLELKDQVKWYEGKVKRRDRREIIAAAISIPLHVLLAFEIDFVLSKIACALSILAFGFVIYKLRSVRLSAPKNDLSLPFKKQLNQRKSYLKRQAHLLDSVLFWYAGPIFLFNTLFILGIGDTTLLENPSSVSELFPTTWTGKTALILFFGLITWWVVGMNKKAAKVNVLPIVKDIERLEQELEEG